MSEKLLEQFDAMTGEYWTISVVLATDYGQNLNPFYTAEAVKVPRFVIGREGCDGWQAEKRWELN